MNIINKVFFILLVLAVSPLFAQNDLSFGYRKPEAETITFVQKINDAGWLAATVQNPDGSYVTVSGSGYYHQSILVRKIKASGQKVWERTLDFEDSTEITGIAQTTDGGFAIVGYGCKEPYCIDVTGQFLVKLRPNGTVAWNRRLTDGLLPYYNLSQSVIPTSDGGVISIGAFVVVRFTATGDVVWMKSFSGFDSGELVSVATHDNGIIVATRIHSFKKDGVNVMKITDSGNVLWRKSLEVEDFDFQSAGITTNNGVILAGNGTNSNKLKIIVLNAGGALNWRAEYSLKGSGTIHSVASPNQTTDGGYVITGSGRGFGFIAKIDSSRKLAFQYTFRASGKSVFVTSDGGFLLFANVDSTSLLISKVNSEGMTECGFFKPLGAGSRTSFGALKLTGLDTAATDIPMEELPFALTSDVTDHPVSNLCK